MVLVSYSGKEINAKLVYYGPGLSGKTTNLEYIYGSIPGDNRGKMVSMKTKTERTLFFDFLPVQLGELSGFKTRFLLYTVPGQVYYNATRKLVLKGVDAVVFVADSKRGKMDENVESLENLKENLREHGLTLDEVPFVLQYNKRDLPDVYTVDELNRVLNPLGVPAYEAVASQGPGVVDTFKAVSRLLLKKLSGEIGVSMTGISPAPPQQAIPAVEPVRSITSTPTVAAAEPSPGGVFTGGATGAPTDPNLAGATAAATPGRIADAKPFPNAVDADPVSGSVSPDVSLSSSAEELPPISRVSSPPKTLTGLEENRAGSVKNRLSRWLRRGEETAGTSGELGAAAAENREVVPTEAAGSFFEAANSTESAPESAPAFTQGPTDSLVTETAEEPSGPIAATPLNPIAQPTAQPAFELTGQPTGGLSSDTGSVGTESTPTATDLGVVTGGPREIIVPVRLELSPEDFQRGVVVRLDIQLGDAEADQNRRAA